jgi:hypothetical protein
MILLAQELTTNATTMAVVAGIIYAFIQLITTFGKLIFDKMLPNKQDKENEILKKQIGTCENYLKELHDMHNKFDLDGTPLWYVPRSWSETQDKILDCVRDISNTQRDLGKIMDKMTTVLDNIDRREH